MVHLCAYSDFLVDYLDAFTVTACCPARDDSDCTDDMDDLSMFCQANVWFTELAYGTGLWIAHVCDGVNGFGMVFFGA